MVPVLLTIHTLVIVALIGVVLLQRSDGGAVLSGGSFMTGRGTANALTRTTSILAAVFFTTSLSLAIIAARGEKERSVIEELTGVPGSPDKPVTSTDDLLKSLGAEPDAAPQPAPSTAAPAQPSTQAPAPAGTPPVEAETAAPPAEQTETPSKPAPAEPQPQ